MRLQEQRTDGEPLQIRGSEVPFSLFPTDYAGQNFVPLQEPWSYVEFHIKNEYPHDRVRYALAYVEQAQSFFQAAKLANRDAAPLLWYYCFLNLIKSLSLNNIWAVFNTSASKSRPKRNATSPNNFPFSFRSARGFSGNGCTRNACARPSIVGPGACVHGCVSSPGQFAEHAEYSCEPA